MGAFQVGAFQTDFQGTGGLAETPAGRPRRRRLFVEIDGEAFWVKSEEEARSLLLKARETARGAAELTAKRQRVSAEPIRAPRIRGSKALEAPIAEARRDLTAIFARSIDYELYELLAARLRQEDDEEVLLLL